MLNNYPKAQNTLSFREKTPIGFKEITLLILCSIVFINIKGLKPVDYLSIPVFFLYLPEILKAFRKILKQPLAVMGAVLFSVSYLLSMWLSDFNTSFVGNLLLNLILSSILVSGCSTPRKASHLIIVLSWSFGLSSVIAWLQYIYILPTFPGQFEIVRDGRFMSLFGDPNLIGIFSIFLGIYWLGEIINPNPYYRSNIIVSFTLLAIAFFHLLLSQSRSAWIGFIVAVIAYLIMTSVIKRSRGLVSITFIMIFLILAASILIKTTKAGDIIIDRIWSVFENRGVAEEERFTFFYTLRSFQVALDNPLGVGPGMTSVITGLTSVDGDPIGAHNTYVQILAENGWIAGVVFIASIVWILYSSIRGGFVDRRRLGISESVISAAFLGLATCGTFHDLIEWRLMWILPSIYVAMRIQTQ